MDPEEFRKLVEDIGLSPVPEKFRPLIKNVAFLVEDDVPDQTRQETNLPPDQTLLGLYKGIPQTQRTEGYGLGALPDTITLFRKPILQAAGRNPGAIRRTIEETIWHEVAHHFGLDESMVRSAEMRRNKKTSNKT